MKTTIKCMTLLAMTLVFALSSCTKEGPVGPAGPAGPAGIQGEQGEQGVPGQAGESPTFNPIFFKVRGNGFAVKDLDGGTSIETDIWDIINFDTAGGFDTTTKRFIVPETGYYFLQAYIRQSNTVTNAFFRVNFNVDNNSRYSQIVDGDDVKINVSGIYNLVAGQEVYVLLRNFSSGTDVRIDGTGSWFEGYKIN